MIRRLATRGRRMARDGWSVGLGALGAHVVVVFDDPARLRYLAMLRRPTLVATGPDVAHEAERLGHSGVLCLPDFAEPHATFDELFATQAGRVEAFLGEVASSAREKRLAEILVFDVLRHHSDALHLVRAAEVVRKRVDAKRVLFRVRAPDRFLAMTGEDQA
ncbi:MAG: hypothetical protein U0169_23915 [Polyangiaceae bacterium]